MHLLFFSALRYLLVVLMILSWSLLFKAVIPEEIKSFPNKSVSLKNSDNPLKGTLKNNAILNVFPSETEPIFMYNLTENDYENPKIITKRTGGFGSTDK